MICLFGNANAKALLASSRVNNVSCDCTSCFKLTVCSGRSQNLFDTLVHDYNQDEDKTPTIKLALKCYDLFFSKMLMPKHFWLLTAQTTHRVIVHHALN